jgi:hypothetical protein
MLEALQFKERLIRFRIWLRRFCWYSHAQIDDVVILCDRPSLNGYGSIGRLLIGNRFELSVSPLKDYLPVGAALTRGFQQHLCFIGDLTAILIKI